MSMQNECGLTSVSPVEEGHKGYRVPWLHLYRSTFFWTHFIVNQAAFVVASFWMART